MVGVKFHTSEIGKHYCQQQKRPWVLSEGVLLACSYQGLSEPQTHRNWESLPLVQMVTECTESLKGIIPSPIQKYTATNYPDAKVLKIERDKTDYEVKLSNGWELKFDSKFNLIDIDN